MSDDTADTHSSTDGLWRWLLGGLAGGGIILGLLIAAYAIGYHRGQHHPSTSRRPDRAHPDDDDQPNHHHSAVADARPGRGHAGPGRPRQEPLHSDGCSACHSLTGSAGVGPSFKGLAGSTRHAHQRSDRHRRRRLPRAVDRGPRRPDRQGLPRAVSCPPRSPATTSPVSPTTSAPLSRSSSRGSSRGRGTVREAPRRSTPVAARGANGEARRRSKRRRRQHCCPCTSDAGGRLRPVPAAADRERPWPFPDELLLPDSGRDQQQGDGQDDQNRAVCLVRLHLHLLALESPPAPASAMDRRPHLLELWPPTTAALPGVSAETGPRGVRAGRRAANEVAPFA